MEISDIISLAEKESLHFFEEKLRETLSNQDKEWLEEQLLQFIVKEKHDEVFHEISSTKKKHTHETLSQRKERVARIRALNLSVDSLQALNDEFKTFSREYLEENGFIIECEHKGLGIITNVQRSDKGNALLTKAKDVLFAILFCSEKQNVLITRHKRDDLTITVATEKVHCLENFMLAVTEFPVKGIWYDPEGVSDDDNATNTVMQVEFSDDQQCLCSKALMSVLALINNLEINEEILYCRIEQAQFSSLV